MKLCSYTTQGQTRTGIVVEDSVIDTGVPGTMTMRDKESTRCHSALLTDSAATRVGGSHQATP